MTTLLQITSLLNALLGVFTLLSKYDSVRNFYFFLTSIGIAGWAFTNSEFQTAVDANSMHFWAIIAYQAATLMLFSVRIFSYSLVYDSQSKNKLRFYLSLLFLAFGVVAPLIPGLISSGVNFDQKSIIAGPGQILLFIGYIYLISDSIHTLYRGISIKTKDKEKAQLQLVSIGLTGAVIAGVSTNIVLPAMGIYDAVALGPSFTLILLSLVTYAIVRHQFLDIRILFGRIFYHLIMASLPFSLFFVLVYFYEQIFGSVFHPAVYFLSILVGVGFVITFNNLEQYIKTQVTTRLINPGYNPIEVVKDYVDQINTILEVSGISKELNNSIRRTIRPEYSMVILFPDTEGLRKETKIYYHGENIPFIEIDFVSMHSALTVLWSEEAARKHLILIDELEVPEMIPKEFGLSIVADLLIAAQKLRIKLVAPIEAEGRVVGAYVFGAKESDSFYNSADKEFVASLLSATTAGIQRTLLYSEVQNFADTLQGKVDEATDQLRQALTEVQEARRKEKDMVDVMGHELRTPLSIIRNAVPMMHLYAKVGGGNNADKIVEYATIANDAVRRESTLVETLLSATKVDAGRIQLYFEKVNLKQTIATSMMALSRSAEIKGLKINVQAPTEDLLVYSDSVKLQEIVDNFFSNAIKYTLQGSVNINVWTDNEYAWVRIKDTGIGIGEEDLPLLGRKFFRAKQHVPRELLEESEADLAPSTVVGNKREGSVVRPGGTGLGLYVAFEFVRLLQGKLFLNSKVGEGTAFTFSVPLYKNQPAQQYDQTFDETPNNQNHALQYRPHLTINGTPPQPPATVA